MNLFVELVCSSAGQSAAFPPAADPCQMCEGGVAVPEGTHSPAGTKIKACYCRHLHSMPHSLVNTERNTGTDLFFSCNFNGSGGNLRRKRNENSQPEPGLLLISNFMIRLKYADFVGNGSADKFLSSKLLMRICKLLTVGVERCRHAPPSLVM